MLYIYNYRGSSVLSHACTCPISGCRTLLHWTVSTPQPLLGREKDTVPGHHPLLRPFNHEERPRTWEAMWPPPRSPPERQGRTPKVGAREAFHMNVPVGVEMEPVTCSNLLEGLCCETSLLFATPFGLRTSMLPLRMECLPGSKSHAAPPPSSSLYPLLGDSKPFGIFGRPRQPRALH